MNDHLEKLIKDLEVKKNDSISYLTSMVPQIESLTLIANSSFYNHLHDVDNYQDNRGDKMFIVSEFIALLCLKIGYVSETKIKDKFELNSTFQKIQEAAVIYVSVSKFLNDIKNHKSDSPNQLTSYLLSAEITSEHSHVRNLNSPEHYKEVTIELFSKYEDLLKNSIGFTAKEAFEIQKSFPEITNNFIQNEKKRRKETAKQLEKEILYFRKNIQIKNDSLLSQMTIEKFKLIGNKDLLKHCMQIQFQNFEEKIRSAYLITADTIASNTTLDNTTIESYLNCFSMNFGDVNKIYEMNEGINPLMYKPLVNHSNFYLPPSLPLLSTSIEKVLDDTLKKQKGKKSENFKNYKHDFLLNKGVNLISNLLEFPLISEQNVYYEVEGEKYELDGLIIYDNIAFIIEMKSQRFSERAKTGYYSRIEKHLEEIISDSHKQELRAKKFFQSKSIVEVTLSNRKKLAIDTSKIIQYIPISITYESLSHLTPYLKTSNKLELFEQGEFPFVVSIFDLIIICDLLNSPSQFTLFLRKRKQFLTQESFQTYDELDILSYFLTSLLDFDHLNSGENEEKNTYHYFDNATDKINQYYMYKYGVSKKRINKPSLDIIPEFLRFIRRIENTELEFRVQICELLYELSDDSKKRFLKSLKKVRKQFKKDKKNHDFSLTGERNDRWGITYMIGRDQDDLQTSLNKYCNHKKNQLGASSWVGIGEIGSKSPRIKLLCKI